MQEDSNKKTTNKFFENVENLKSFIWKRRINQTVIHEEIRSRQDLRSAWDYYFQNRSLSLYIRKYTLKYVGLLFCLFHHVDIKLHLNIKAIKRNEWNSRRGLRKLELRPRKRHELWDNYMVRSFSSSLWWSNKWWTELLAHLRQNRGAFMVQVGRREGNIPFVLKWRVSK
jgi:hypothetical protein